MSKYSPSVIADSEILTRFVFSPMHVSKQGTLKPSLFSHVDTVGCSVQRESCASLEELTNFVRNFLAGGDKPREWFGAVQGISKDLRAIDVTNSSKRNVCLYDTAEPDNISHAEIHKTDYVIDDADKLELKSELFKAFGNSILIKPTTYRAGSILQNLSSN